MTDTDDVAVWPNVHNVLFGCVMNQSQGPLHSPLKVKTTKIKNLNFLKIHF